MYGFISCEKDPEQSLDTELKQVMDNSSPSGSHTYYILPQSTDFGHIPNQDVKNKLTIEKVNLGRLLFFETGIGQKSLKPENVETYSCSTCHIPERSFTAGRIQGIADGAMGFGVLGEARVKNPLFNDDEVDAQGARPLPVINLAFVTNALWAGTFGSFGVNKGTESVWSQDTLININHEGLEGLEANNIRALLVHRQFMDKVLAEKLGYKAMFDQAFPDIPENERYTLKTTAFAIAAYFRTIFTNEAPFQKYLKGNNKAITDQQKQGALLFFTKAGCVSCHVSPSFNNMAFRAVGAFDLYQNKEKTFRTGPQDKRVLGRGGFTQNPDDYYKFKVPQLYNLKNIGFYLHGGSKRSIREAVEYFAKGIPENPLVPATQIAANFTPRNLTSKEIDAVTDFIENALFDPNLTRYKPSAVMSGNCFPNNDKISRKDLGCD